MNRSQRRKRQRMEERVMRMAFKGWSCARCHRPYDAHGAWVYDRRDGWIKELICPGCCTDWDYAEAEVNDATQDYAILPSGQLWAFPKGTLYPI